MRIVSMFSTKSAPLQRAFAGYWHSGWGCRRAEVGHRREAEVRDSHKWLIVISSSSPGCEQAKNWYLKPMAIRSYSCVAAQGNQSSCCGEQARSAAVVAAIPCSSSWCSSA